MKTGGDRRRRVGDVQASTFVGRRPADTAITPTARTIVQGRVIDARLERFTHDMERPAILPGVAPTRRHVEDPFVPAMGVLDGLLTDQHSDRAQASRLVRTGLLDPRGLPLAGGGRARRRLAPTLPAKALIAEAESREAW